MARDLYPPALSKTAKYKKYTKPMLERKRRARINRCLDELKDLMVGALEIDDENLSKLEKADILELTVNHLMKLHSPKDPVIEAKKFQAGFGQCAAEACRFIMTLPDLDANVSQNLVNHLSRLVSTQPLSIQVPNRPTYSPPISPPSPNYHRERVYYSDERSSTDGEVDGPYSDRYPDDVSQYSAASNQSHHDLRMPAAVINATPSVKDLASPMSGLLTTVNRLHGSSKQMEPQIQTIDRTQGNQFFNRVPAECKDAILQKIRQHIMDKRGNDSAEIDSNAARSSQEHVPRISVREDLTKEHYPTYAQISNDTLDLRKIRTPVKHSPEKTSSNYLSLTNASPSIEPKPPQPLTLNKLQNDIANNPMDIKKTAQTDGNLTEQLAVDYSNLPPKKKRKLLEYQEYKKQEESKRLEEIAKRQRNDYREKGPFNCEQFDSASLANQWRPW